MPRPATARQRQGHARRAPITGEVWATRQSAGLVQPFGRSCLGGTALVAVAIVPAPSLGRPAAPGHGPGREGFAEVWSRTLPDAGAPVALSSPNIATLDGNTGRGGRDRSGHVYAFSLATGRPYPDGRPARAGSRSTPRPR